MTSRQEATEHSRQYQDGYRVEIKGGGDPIADFDHAESIGKTGTVERAEKVTGLATSRLIGGAYAVPRDGGALWIVHDYRLVPAATAVRDHGRHWLDYSYLA